MNSIFKKPSVGKPQGRNGFDLSFMRSYTCPCGALLPVAHDIANAGDKYVLNTSSFIRTEALETAAFCKLKMHVDWFFVPMTQIYSRWNEFYNQVDDVMSSLFVSPNSTPYKYELPQFEVFPGPFGFPNGKLNSFFGYSSTESTNQVFSLISDPYGVPYLWNFRRLWDMLGYGSVDSYGSNMASTTKFTLLPFLAYHKIFHSHYLLTDWFKNDPKLYNVDSYVDPNRTHASSELPAILSTLHYRPYRKDYFTNVLPSPIFSDAYANYINGSFTGVNLRDIINPELSKGIQNGANTVSLVGSGSNASVEISNPSWQNLNNISPADLRSMYALDKLMRINAFSKSHYADQVAAHLGFDIPEGISDEAYKLGSQVTDIDINEVVATASSSGDDGSVLGDIAGKAFGLTRGDKDINFTCPADGIIMGIASIEPIPRYSSRFCDRQNRYRSTYDFYHSEFDNVGMQPMEDSAFAIDFETPTLLGWQYRYSEYKTKVDVVNEGFWNTYRSNWTPTKQDMFNLSDITNSKVTPSLEATFYCFPQYTNTMFGAKVPFYNNLNAPTFRVPKTNVLDAQSIVFDPTFSSTSKCSAADVYDTDNFLVDMSIKMFKTSIMSVHSLPKIM